MMKQMIALGFFLLLAGFVASASAGDRPDPDRVREVFALSGDSNLQLAADALGNDGLLTLFDELKSGSSNGGIVKKILKRGK